MSRPAYEVAHMINSVKSQLPEIVNNTWKQRTLYALCRCRTDALGGHIDRCDNPTCNKVHISYNSCRNRHCPKCQGHLREQWISKRETELINAPYFHVVFTLPDQLNPLALGKPKLIYGLLFKTAWSVINDFGTNPKMLGAQTGMISILHTWGQNLSLHPHLHCIVPAGGVAANGKWKSTKSKGRFLFPVKAMSKVFRARFIKALRQQVDLSQARSDRLFDKPWVVFAKRPFFGPKQVIEYLGRYTHKIAISNPRIVNLSEGRVSFRVKDYRHMAKQATITLTCREFIRRFSLHMLPKGFTRIRHYGILNGRMKAVYKNLADNQLGKIHIEQIDKPDLHRK